jgi:hypothetical protein
MAHFGGGGQVGLDNGELGQALQGAPAAAGGALLHAAGHRCRHGPAVTAWQHGHTFVTFRYSVTSGGGGGLMSRAGHGTNLG